MSALDADVIKAYVELELGVGIIASTGVRSRTRHRLADARLRAPVCEQYVKPRDPPRFLRGYVFRFIELCSPQLTEKTVRSAMQTSPFAER